MRIFCRKLHQNRSVNRSISIQNLGGNAFSKVKKTLACSILHILKMHAVIQRAVIFVHVKKRNVIHIFTIRNYFLNSDCLSLAVILHFLAEIKIDTSK